MILDKIYLPLVFSFGEGSLNISDRRMRTGKIYFNLTSELYLRKIGLASGVV